MLIVQIDEVSSCKEVVESRHRTSDRREAIDKAIRKHYGKNASLWLDTGISTPVETFGQIVVPAKTFNGYNCITGRVAISVTEAAGR